LQLTSKFSVLASFCICNARQNLSELPSYFSALLDQLTCIQLVTELIVNTVDIHNRKATAACQVLSRLTAAAALFLGWWKTDFMDAGVHQMQLLGVTSASEESSGG
jgi:hypothetical protein